MTNARAGAARSRALGIVLPLEPAPYPLTLAFDETW